jgi:hypothetical protein
MTEIQKLSQDYSLLGCDAVTAGITLNLKDFSSTWTGCCVNGRAVPDVSKDRSALIFRLKQSSADFGLLDCDDEGNRFLRNVRHYTPSYSVTY